MPRERRKKGPAYTPPKSSIPKKDYTPNVNPHQKKPPRPDLNRGRRKTGEAAIQARAETVAEAKRRTEEYAVRVRVPKRLRCLARIILPGAPIALQISPSLSSQDLEQDPVRRRAALPCELASELCSGSREQSSVHAALQNEDGSPIDPAAAPASAPNVGMKSDSIDRPSQPPKKENKNNPRRWRRKNNKRKGKKPEKKADATETMTQDTENTEGVGWTFDCALRGLGEILSNHPKKTVKSNGGIGEDDTTARTQVEGMEWEAEL
ncbi:hypothetical protein ACEPPN_009219 [Leptodophora sp. 'Broadleaf-Isolate-01']